jgi:SAP domain
MDTQWRNLTVSALKRKCEDRRLPKSGVKADLLKRLREHDEKFRRSAAPEPPSRQYDQQEPSSQSVSRKASNTVHPPEANVRLDQEPSTGARVGNANLTEEELEQILRDNYVSVKIDPKGKVRKSTILTDFNLSSEEAKKKRDTMINKVKTKYNKDMEKLGQDRIRN